MKSVTISIYIQAPPSRVYEFVSDPTNLPLWITFFRSVTLVNGAWCVETPEGPAAFSFAEPNPNGVLDHTITLKSGRTVTNPMRVVPNGSGSELQFTLFQREGVTDEEFRQDEAQVKRDLDSLRRILERHDR